VLLLAAFSGRTAYRSSYFGLDSRRNGNGADFKHGAGLRNCCCRRFFAHNAPLLGISYGGISGNSGRRQKSCGLLSFSEEVRDNGVEKENSD